MTNESKTLPQAIGATASVDTVEPIEDTNILPERIVGFIPTTGFFPEEAIGHMVEYIQRNGTTGISPADEVEWARDNDHPNAYDVLYYRVTAVDNTPVPIDPSGATEYAEHMRNIQEMINTGIGTAMVAVRPSPLVRDSLRVMIDSCMKSDDIVACAAANRVRELLMKYDANPKITISHTQLNDFSLQYEVITTPLVVGGGYTVEVRERDLTVNTLNSIN